MSILINDKMPITSKGFRSLAQTDYGTFDKAISELIDNAWEVGYPTTFSNVIGRFNGANKGLTAIEILDNGPGMTLETLSKCLSVGSETDKTNETLGTYGMGMKTSTLWCGKHAVIYTKCEGGQLLKATYDWNGDRQVESIDDISCDEYERFCKTVRGCHGTVIIIDHLNTYHFPKTKKSFYMNLNRGLGVIFSDLLQKRKVNMMVGGVRVEPVSYVDKENSELISDPDAVWAYTGVDGVEKKIRYEAWFTPETAAKAKDFTERFLPRNQENQGFICIRNGHMTGHGLTFGIVTKNNIMNGCKIILYLDSTTDDDFGVSYGKTQRGTISSDEIKECFRKEFKRYFDLSAKMQTQNRKNGETSEIIDRVVKKIEDEIANNQEIQDLLKDMRCNAEIEKTKGVNKKNEEQKKTETKKDTQNTDAEKKHRKPREDVKIKACGRNFVITHEAFGADNEYFQPDLTPEGKGVCRVNTEHNYYTNFIDNNSEVVNLDVYRNFVCEWISVYGTEEGRTEEAIDQYNKRLLAKSRALSSIYKDKNLEGGE